MATKTHDKKNTPETAIEPRFRVDLNLLYVFDAVMTELHVTRAAERLNMTQSAVSNALSRLRKVFKDQLFVKSIRGVDATPRALALWPRVHRMLEEVEDSVHPRTFDALRSQRQFRIAMADITVSLIAPHLQRIVHAKAPQTSLFFVPHDPAATGSRLMRGELDFAVSIDPTRAAVIESMPLFSDSWVVVARQGHPLLKHQPSLAAFCSAPHVAVNESGDEMVPNLMDAALAQRGLTRNVVLTVNQFSVVASILKNSSLIAALPFRFAMATGAGVGRELVTQPLPLAVPDSVVHLSWHRRFDSAPPQRWLKQQLLEATAALNTETESVAPPR